VSQKRPKSQAMLRGRDATILAVILQDERKRSKLQRHFHQLAGIFQTFMRTYKNFNGVYFTKQRAHAPANLHEWRELFLTRKRI